jgi:hypothetical protein
MGQNEFLLKKPQILTLMMMNMHHQEIQSERQMYKLGGITASNNVTVSVLNLSKL